MTTLLPQSVLVSQACFDTQLRGVPVQSWGDFVATISGQPRHRSDGFGSEICGIASIGVLNVAIWGLLVVVFQYWHVGLFFTVAYGVGLLAFIRRCERISPDNDTLLNYLWPGMPVVAFVIGLYAVRCWIEHAPGSLKNIVWLVVIFASGPSLVLSVWLLLFQKRGPLVLNVFFGIFLFVMTTHVATRVSIAQGVRIDEFMNEATARPLYDFTARLMFVEGLVGCVSAIWLHKAGSVKRDVVSWLQIASSLTLHIGALMILCLPVWENTASELARWCLHAALCAGLLAAGSFTRTVAPGFSGALGLFLIFLRIALASTDIARWLGGLTWKVHWVSLMCVFSTSLAVEAFGALYLSAARRHSPSRN